MLVSFVGLFSYESHIFIVTQFVFPPAAPLVQDRVFAVKLLKSQISLEFTIYTNGRAEFWEFLTVCVAGSCGGGGLHAEVRNILQHTATHCNTLQHTAIHCNTLQQTAIHCNILQHTATMSSIIHCNTLQHTATHCNTLQYTATHCNTLSR